ncbi:hypothetical protein EBZ37_03075 [bacterium]|nr:hypothetical protein [bacterium]
MWQANGRRRSFLGVIHNTPLRETKTFHVKRVEAQLTSVDGSVSAISVKVRLLLNDLSSEGLAVYSPELLAAGTLVSLELEHPEHINLRLKVGWCQQLTGAGRVISSSSQSYRIGLVFDYEQNEERDRVKAFCEKLAQAYPGVDLTRAPYAA